MRKIRDSVSRVGVRILCRLFCIGLRETVGRSYITLLKQTCAKSEGRRRVLVPFPKTLKNRRTRKRRDFRHCKGSRRPVFEAMSSLDTLDAKYSESSEVCRFVAMGKRSLWQHWLQCRQRCESAIAKAIQKRRIAMRGQSTTRSKLSHQYKF